MGCYEPSEKGQLMTRSQFCGGIPHSWGAQKPLVSYPGPLGTQSKPSLPFLLLLPPGKMAFVPCDTLSQSVGGGRGKGLCGEQGRWVWGWRAGKVTHFAFPSSSVPPVTLLRQQLSPPGRCLSGRSDPGLHDCPGTLSGKVHFLPGFRSVVNGS